ncbi:MAG: glycosyltransferase family 2 protein [Anaerolineales bacterium]|nr:glycosyltransferase family 2 protein [Anaerolineales bacterium]
MSPSLSSTSRTLPSLAVIIPVYNEALGVKRVLEIVCKFQEVQEIIVVDDGSTDASVQMVVQTQECEERIHLISHLHNRGKGQAVHTGLITTQAEVIILLDADLRGLEVRHLEDLVSPVVSGYADMTIGVFRGGKFYSDFSHWATPWLSGQRCIWKSYLESISWKAAEGYGLETAITVASLRNNWRCQKVIWRGVFHPPSEMHRGPLRGLLNRGKMYAQVGRAFLIASLDPSH